MILPFFTSRDLGVIVKNHVSKSTDNRTDPYSAWWSFCWENWGSLSIFAQIEKLDTAPNFCFLTMCHAGRCEMYFPQESISPFCREPDSSYVGEGGHGDGGLGINQQLIREIASSYSDGKESACDAGDGVQSLGWENVLEKEMATQLQYCCLENPWTEEPGGLQFMASHRVRHNWATNICSEEVCEFLLSFLCVVQGYKFQTIQSTLAGLSGK